MGRIMREWLPSYGSGEYNPGDARMDSPVGQSVADRTPTRSKVGRYDTDMEDQGKVYPRDHNETAAMCDVDDDGVEHKPQGVHNSTHGEPDDGIQDKVGHNWPDEPKNSGGSIEPFEGERWSDGGTLKSSSRESSDDDVSEGWSPDDIGSLMEEDYNIQELFDNYANTTDKVNLENFQNLCDAHGLPVTLNEKSMLTLMNVNQDFMFYEHNDSNGTYWLVSPISEDSDSSDGTITEGKTKKNRTISELQIRSPEQEANLYSRDDLNKHRDSAWGSDDSADGRYGGDPDLGEYEPDLNSFGSPMSANREHEDAMQSGESFECQGCGYNGAEEECPECGMEMTPASHGGMDDFGTGRSGLNDAGDLDDDFGVGSSPRQPSMMRQRPQQNFSPRAMESVENFLASTHSIIDNGIENNYKNNNIAEALSYSWMFHIGNIDPYTLPTKVTKVIESLNKKYPNFNPMLESDAIDPPDGVKIGSSGSYNTPDDLPEQPHEIEKISGGDNLLTKKQNNSNEGTPIIPGSERMTESILQRNINKLSRYVKSSLSENAPATKGKYKVYFEVAVLEGKGKNKKKNKTPKRTGLAEALADVEEILQFHNPENVNLETSFVDSTGSLIFKHDIPLMTIDARGPIYAENKTVFRFRRNAENFAQELVSEGVTCKVMSHNWGCAVDGRFDRKLATEAFNNLTEKKAFKNTEEDDCNGKACLPKNKRLNIKK